MALAGTPKGVPFQNQPHVLRNRSRRSTSPITNLPTTQSNPFPDHPISRSPDSRGRSPDHPITGSPDSRDFLWKFAVSSPPTPGGRAFLLQTNGITPFARLVTTRSKAVF